MNKFKKAMLSTSLVVASSVLAVGCSCFDKKNNQITDQELQFDVKESLTGKGYKHLSYVKQKDGKYKIILQVEDAYIPKDAKVTNKDKTYTFTYSEQEDAYIAIIEAKKGDKLTIDGSLIEMQEKTLKFTFEQCVSSLLPSSTSFSFVNPSRITKLNTGLNLNDNNRYSISEFEALLDNKEIKYKVKEDFGIKISYNLEEYELNSRYYLLLDLLNNQNLFSQSSLSINDNFVTQVITANNIYEVFNTPSFDVHVSVDEVKYSINTDKMDNFANLINCSVTEDEMDGFYLKLSTKFEFDELEKDELSNVLNRTTISDSKERIPFQNQYVDDLLLYGESSIKLQAPLNLSVFTDNGKDALGFHLEDDFNAQLIKEGQSLVKKIDDKSIELIGKNGIELSIAHDSNNIFNYLNDRYVYNKETYKVNINFDSSHVYNSLIVEITSNNKTFSYMVESDGTVTPLGSEKIPGVYISYNYLRIEEGSNVTQIKVSDDHIHIKPYFVNL